jgi:hypothetical protein
LIRIISLGAGVQSTTMALMAAHGEIGPMPDCAVFADTGNEPAAVYEHVRWMRSSNVLPFPVHVITAGNLGEAIMASARGESKKGSHARPPFYVRSVSARGLETEGMVRRQCTGDFKIDPIEKKIRALMGLKRRQAWPKIPTVEQWIGISTDEAMRMKPSRRESITMRWPLIEKRMARSDCLLWLQRNSYPIPAKSACTFCPFRSDDQWRWLRDNDAAGWDEALRVDAAIRRGINGIGLRGELFLHRSMMPLAEVDLSTDAERGQPDLFNNDCEGMCGV